MCVCVCPLIDYFINHFGWFNPWLNPHESPENPTKNGPSKSRTRATAGSFNICAWTSFEAWTNLGHGTILDGICGFVWNIWAETVPVCVYIYNCIYIYIYCIIFFNSNRVRYTPCFGQTQVKLPAKNGTKRINSWPTMPCLQIAGEYLVVQDH